MLTAESLGWTAKQLAMRSNGWSEALASAAAGRSAYPAEVTGLFVSLIAPIVEKAVAASGLPADVAYSLARRYVVEYEEVVKLVANAGGFSNFVQKAVFNARFHAMFTSEYTRYSKLVEDVWVQAQEEGAEPVSALAQVTVVCAQAACREAMREDAHAVRATSSAISNLFSETKQIVNGP